MDSSEVCCVCNSWDVEIARQNIRNKKFACLRFRPHHVHLLLCLCTYPFLIFPRTILSTLKIIPQARFIHYRQWPQTPNPRKLRHFAGYFPMMSFLADFLPREWAELVSQRRHLTPRYFPRIQTPLLLRRGRAQRQRNDQANLAESLRPQNQEARGANPIQLTTIEYPNLSVAEAKERPWPRKSAIIFPVAKEGKRRRRKKKTTRMKTPALVFANLPSAWVRSHGHDHDHKLMPQEPSIAMLTSITWGSIMITV